MLTTAGALVCAILVVPQSAHAVDAPPALARAAVVDQDSVLAVNADGTELAYTNLAGGHHQLYRYDKSSGSRQSITGSSDGDTTAVAIDGSGSEIAFVSDATDLDASGAALVSGTPQAYVAQFSGGTGTLTRLPLPAGDTTGAGEVAISKDGSLVAFGDGTHVQLWRSGRPLTAVDVTPSGATAATAHRVTLSADGSTLATVVDDGSGTGRLVLADLTDGTRTTMPVAVDLRSPAALTGDGGTVIAAPAGEDYLLSWLWRGGGTPSEIDSWGSSIAGYPSVSADGHFIAQSWKMSDEDGYLVPVDIGGTDHVLVSVDDSNYQTPTTGFGNDPTLAESRPQLSADGLTVAFRSNAQLAGQPGPAPAGQTVLYLARLNDDQAPTLDTYQPLTVDDVQPSSVALALPNANDDLAVVRMAVTDNGAPASNTTPGQGDFTVAGLQPGTQHTFTVTAYDQSGHASASQSVQAWTPKSPVAGSFDSLPVSALPAGAAGSGIEVSGRPAIDDAGRYVAYAGAPITGYGTDGSPTTGSAELYLTDTTGATTTLVTHQAGSAGTPATDAAIASIALSGNGRYLAYVATSSELVTPAPAAGPQLYVYDRTTGTSVLVPTQYPVLTSTFGPAPQQVRMSADGTRLLALTQDQNGYTHAEVLDWQSATDGLLQTNAPYIVDLALSGDGSTVAVAGSGEVPETDVFDADTLTQTGVLDRVAGSLSLNADGSSLLVGNGALTMQVATTSLPAPQNDGSTVPDRVFYGGLQVGAAAPDGVHVAYTDSGSSGDTVYLGTLPDGAPLQVAAGDSPALNGDGSALAYVAQVDDGAGDHHHAVVVARPHDGTPPSWPAGATLDATDATTTSTHLSWPAATDNVGVTSYVLTEDGKAHATLAGDVRSYDVTGLSANTSYTFAVVAKDAVGNASPALSATVKTLGGGITPGTDPLIAVAQPGGVVALSWDPDDAAAGGYRVMRDDGSGFAKVADVAAGKTSYTDTGRLAETSFTYRVDALDGTGTAGPWTETASVTTPAIAIDKATATIPYLSGTSVAALGGSVALRVTGEPNRQGSARIDYWTHADPGGAVVTQTADVPLAEDTGQPGTYTGSWTIPEGAGQITAVTGVLSDGMAAHDATIAAAGLPVTVSGALAVTVGNPPNGTLAGSELDVDGPDYSHSITVDAAGTYTVPAPAGAGYDVTLRSSAFADLAEATRDVTAGLTTTLDLAPDFQSSLVVTVVKADGSKGGVSVAVTDANGNLVAGQDLATGQSTVTFTGLAAGTFVTVTSTLDNASEPLYMQADAERYLVGGENDVTLTQVALPTGTISGTVTSSDGQALVSGASVHVTVTDGTRAFGYDATTDSAGQYSVAVAAGSATVAVSATGYFGASGPATVVADRTATHDVQLERQADLTVHVIPPTGIRAGDATVVVTDAAGSTMDAQTIPNDQTDATFTNLHLGAKYGVSVTVNDRSRTVQLKYATTATMSSYDESVTVQEVALPSATLIGTVTTDDGAGTTRPAVGASVDVVDAADGHDWVATTDDQGQYRLTVLSGALRVVVKVAVSGFRTEPDAATVTLAEGSTVTHDVRFLLTDAAPEAGGGLTFPTGTVATTADGQPVLQWMQSATTQTSGCAGGIATASIVGQNSNGRGDFQTWAYRTYVMSESAPGSTVFTGTLPPQYPMHGAVDVSKSVVCPPQQLMTPSTGPAGTTVRAMGSGFSTATGVRFGSVPATNFAVFGDGLLQAVAPAGTGTVPVVADTATGSVPLGQYTYSDSASVASAVSPELTTASGTGLHPSLARPAPLDITLTGILAWLYSKGPGVLSNLLNLRSAINGFLNDLHPTCKQTADSVAAAIGALVAPLVKAGVDAALPTIEDLVLAAFAETGPAVLIILALTPLAVTFIAKQIVGALIRAAVEAFFSYLKCPGYPKTDTLIDPSGTVLDTNGNPVARATVTLLRADTEGGRFVPMDAADPGIEPAINPELTDADGVFHWDVRSGYYELRASKSGCTVPGDPTVTDAVTGAYPVPPPQVGLTVTLACPNEPPPPVPTISGLSVSHGPPAGGTPVLITGSGFTPSATVSFSGVAASTTYLGPTALSAVAPAGSGLVDVVVQTKGGDSAAQHFFYGDPPTVSGLSLTSGPAAGGTRVTITGTGFTGATLVGFGGAPGTDLKVLSDTQLQVTTPTQLPGTVPAVVVTPVGASTGAAAGQFTFTRVPVVLGVTSAPAAPVYGQDVTLTVTTTPAQPGGAISVSEAGTTLGTATAGAEGTARITLTGLHAGAHLLTVSYLGDADSLPAIATTTVTVAKAATQLSIDRIGPAPPFRTPQELLAYLRALAAYLRHPTVTVHLVRAWDGAPLAGAGVHVATPYGMVCDATTDATGSITCPVPRRMQLLVLRGDVSASYAGSTDYQPSQAGAVDVRHR